MCGGRWVGLRTSSDRDLLFGSRLGRCLCSCTHIPNYIGIILEFLSDVSRNTCCAVVVESRESRRRCQAAGASNDLPAQFGRLINRTWAPGRAVPAFCLPAMRSASRPQAHWLHTRKECLTLFAVSCKVYTGVIKTLTDRWARTTVTVKYTEIPCLVRQEMSSEFSIKRVRTCVCLHACIFESGVLPGMRCWDEVGGARGRQCVGVPFSSTANPVLRFRRAELCHPAQCAGGPVKGQSDSIPHFWARKMTCHTLG